MKPILPPDLFFVRAAEGWLGLGDATEALAELASVSPENRDHPMVLDAEWEACAALRDWDSAHRCGEALVRLYPGLVAGWIHRSYATRRMQGGGLAAALEALRPAADLFPTESMVSFNLACYLAQMGAEEEAWGWYLEAVRRGDADSVREAGLRDEDLRPIWPRIRRDRGEARRGVPD